MSRPHSNTCSIWRIVEYAVNDDDNGGHGDVGDEDEDKDDDGDDEKYDEDKMLVRIRLSLWN